MRKLFRYGMTAVLVMTVVCMVSACQGKKDSEDTAKRLEESNKKAQESENKEEFEFKEEEHGAVLMKYNGKGGEVEVPDQYNGIPVVRIADSAFPNYKDITDLYIPYTVQTIDTATLPEDCGITIHAAYNTAGEMYSYHRNIQNAISGENPAKASFVDIYDTEGQGCERLYVGEEPKEDYMSGISLKQENGETVLVLDNCNVGSIQIEEYAALTIQLAEGSDNIVSAARGADGISSNGRLTITGNGALHVHGSDYYAVRDGDNGTVGWGISVSGDLTITDHVNLEAKSGTSKSREPIGIGVFGGSLKITDSKVESVAPDSGIAGLAVCVTKGSRLDDGMSGMLTLENVQITQGGTVVDIGDTGEEPWGKSIGTAQITYDDIDGYLNAADYVLIEP